MDNVDFYLEDLKTKFKKINLDRYYLSYSGGKDSHLLYWFIKEYAPEYSSIPVVGINTFMEHSQIRERIYKNSDIVLLPKMKPFEIKEKYGIPCFTKIQDEMIDRYQNGLRTPSTMQFIMGTKNGGYTMFKLSKKARTLLLEGKLHKISAKCCDILKKEPAKEYQKQTSRKPILGVRGSEGTNRKSKYKSCFTGDLKFTPLWDLTDELENAIYEKYKIEIPEIYNYVDRTGCMGCPYGSWKHDTEKELALIDENQKKFVCEYFKESYEVLKIKTEGENK